MSASGTWELNFDSAPFCNGSLHLGHVRCYALGDVRARWLRGKGVDVRYATAFDAFGLPHESSASEAGLPTHEYVGGQIARIAGQLTRLGLSYDTDEHPRTCDPSYYRWTQWLFLTLWKAGLVHSEKRLLPYCQNCAEYLASSQVEAGCCWRCGDPVSSRASEEWFIRTSEYSSELASSVDGLSGWSPRARNLMHAFLGRKEGRSSTVRVDLQGSAFQFDLFVPEDVEMTAIALSDEHPLAALLAARAEIGARLPELRIREDPLPPPLCLLEFAGNALPLYVRSSSDLPHQTDALGIASERAVPASIPSLRASRVAGRPDVRFRARDWLVSRRREWATPLPAVNCADCGVRPVAEEDLPVRLPVHGGDGTACCSSCGTRQPTVSRRLDCFLDDAWCFWAAHPDWASDQNPFEVWRERPPDRVFFHSGYDSFVYLYLYRFLGHALVDIGLLHHPDVVSDYLGHDVVTADGRKMSKRHGNAPDLDQLLHEEGSSVLRLAVLAGANPVNPIDWSDDCLQRARRMLRTAERLRRRPRVAQPSRGRNAETLAGPTPAVEAHVSRLLERADQFMAEYRVGSAIGEVYLATKTLLRSDGTNPELEEELRTWWDHFAPLEATTTERLTQTRFSPAHQMAVSG